MKPIFQLVRDIMRKSAGIFLKNSSVPRSHIIGCNNDVALGNHFIVTVSVHPLKDEFEEKESPVIYPDCE